MLVKQSEILELSPLGVVLCDADQRIICCNQRFLDDTGLKEEKVTGSLYASLPLEAIDKNAFLIQLFDLSLEYPKKFSYWQAKLSEPKATTAHYFVLQREETPLKVSLENTKIPKRASWIDFLDYEVSRSRRYSNPLSLLKFQLLLSSQAHDIDQVLINQKVKDTLMDELRWADMFGNTSPGGYLMVLPETPTSALEHLKDKISAALKHQLKSLDTDFTCRIVFGSSHWQQHDDSLSMLKRVRDDLVVHLEKIDKTSSLGFF